MTNEPETRAMSRLLTRGAKMLQEACGDCGNPLFRYDGEVVCAVCNERSKDSESGTRNRTEKQEQKAEQKTPTEGWRDHTAQELRGLATRLASEARDEKDLSRVDDTLNTLERTTQLIERIESKEE